MKQCFKCKRKKSLDHFYKHPAMADGHLGKCKSCAKKDVAKNYRENRDHYIAYEKLRFKQKERKAKLIEYRKKRRELHPGKCKAINAVSNAIRDGRLKRENCEVCRKTAQAHHDYYRSPLVVKWLCRGHHLAAHGKVAA